MNERRSALLLIALVFAQLVLLTSQVPDQKVEGSYLEGSALRVSGPVVHLVDSVVDWFGGLRSGMRTRGQLKKENERLRLELRTLRQDWASNQAAKLQLDLLSEALGYKPSVAGRVRVADVVFIDNNSLLRTLVVYVPDAPDFEFDPAGLPVTTQDGLVGRVISESGDYARVQIVSDRASSVGAMIERTRRQGIVRGIGGGMLSLEYVPLQSEVMPGDQVVTAGIDGVYPRGVPIGTVVTVEDGGDLFHRIRVAPAVDLGTLSQVFLLDWQSPEGALEPATENDEGP